MNAKNLMIGDWVIYNPNVFIGEEYEPTQRPYPRQIMIGEDIDIAIEGCYEPIPLTAEILEKNGFQLDVAKYPKGYFYQFPNEYEDIVRAGFGVELWKDIFLITDHALMPIRYVHELQHALRLCGLNDLADNFKMKGGEDE